MDDGDSSVVVIDTDILAAPTRYKPLIWGVNLGCEAFARPVQRRWTTCVSNLELQRFVVLLVCVR